MLTAHLRKEWREHRLMLIAFVVSLFACSGLTLWIAPKDSIPRDLGAWFATAGMAIAFVGLIGDLVPGESRRAQLDLLRRTPKALQSAFRAKWILLITALFAVTTIGWVTGELTWHLGSGTNARTDGDTIFLWCGLAMLACTPLAFACSCWFGRGSGALPATAMVFGLVAGVPAAVVSIYRLPIGVETVGVMIAWCFVTGLVASAVSFQGLRFGSRWHGLKRGLLCSLLAITPVWGLTGLEVFTLLHFDPSDADARISHAYLSADSDKLFVTVHRDWPTENDPPYTTLIVDLETGAYEQTGSVATTYSVPVAAGSTHVLGTIYRPQGFLVRTDSNRAGESESTHFQLIDGQDGGTIHHFEQPGLDFRKVSDLIGEDRLRDLALERSSLRLPDGTRVAMVHGEILFQGPDGDIEVVEWPDHGAPFLANGFGFRWRTSDQWQEWPIFDLHHREAFEPPEGLEWDGVFARLGTWVVTEEIAGAERARSGVRPFSLRRFDPRTQSSQELQEGLELTSIAMTVNGDLVGVDGRDRGPAVLRIRPDRDVSEALGVDPVARITAVASAGVYRSVPIATPGGHSILRVEDETGETGYARLDGSVLRCTARVDDRPQLVAVLDEDRILVQVGSRSLQILRFGSTGRRVVFETGR